MGITSKRVYKTQHFKAGEKCLHVLTMAALLAAGALALAPRNALAFVCDSGAAGENGEGATDGGVANNTACGVLANAGGAAGFNTAIGRVANASGAGSLNTALGNSAFAFGDTSQNIAIGTQANASGNNSTNTAIGLAAEASGAGGRNIALGVTARALGNNTGNVAIGSSSRAGGGTTLANSSTAVGNASRALFANSAAFGNGATATRANQQVFGTGVNTYTTPGITSAGSTAAQGAVQGVVTTDANGNLASDGGALQTQANSNTTNVATNTTNIAALQAAAGGTANLRRDIDRNARNIDDNREGVAMAMAVAGAVPYLTASETFALSGSLGTFGGENAMAFGGRMRLNNRWSLAGGMGIGLDGRNYGGTVSARIGW